MKKIFFLSVFALIFYSLKAQVNSDSLDEIITVSGETLIGGVTIHNPSEVTIINADKKVVQMTPEDIKSITFKDGRVYHSIKVQESSNTYSLKILRVIEEGYVNLYELENEGEKSYYFKKGNNKIIEINEKYFPNFVKLITYGCDSLRVNCANAENCEVRNYRNLSFSYAALVKIVSNYNRCIDPSTAITINSPKKPDLSSGDGLRWHAEAGIGNSTYSFAYYKNGTDFGDINRRNKSVILNFIAGADYQFKRIVVGAELHYERFHDSYMDRVILPRDKIFYSAYLGYSLRLANNFYFQPQIRYSPFSYVFGSSGFNKKSNNRYAYGGGATFMLSKVYFRLMYSKVNFVLTESGTGLSFEEFKSKFNSVSFTIGTRLPIIGDKK